MEYRTIENVLDAFEGSIPARDIGNATSYQLTAAQRNLCESLLRWLSINGVSLPSASGWNRTRTS